jgi:lysophospholipase L1-like esterase
MRTILGIGASTMAGAGDNVGGFFDRLARQRPDRRFVNFGVGGYKVKDMIAFTDGITAHRPYRSLVLLGCNDVPRTREGIEQHRTTLADYVAQLDQLLAKVRGEDGSVFVSSFQPDVDRSGVAIALMDVYMAEALRLAKGHGYETWDLYHELRESPKLQEYWAADGLHFNANGHAFLAERIGPLL